MKYAVTAVAISRRTRRRVGKARVEIIDTSQNELFARCDGPQSVERVYETFWNDLNPNSPDTVKVVDVREVKS
jgi:hypothetical protein